MIRKLLASLILPVLAAASLTVYAAEEVPSGSAAFGETVSAESAAEEESGASESAADEESVTENAPENTAPGLAGLAQRYGFKLGTCFSFMQLRDKKYLELVKENFTSLTATNELKAYSLLDERASKKAADGMPVMNYAMADQMVAWAQENGIGIRGHVLVWDAYMTDWYFHEDYDSKKPYADKETIKERTEYYIREVITHFEEKFPGVVYCWDVVNEAVADSEAEALPGDARHLRALRSGSENLFLRYMGDDYVQLSFLYAKNTVEELGADIDLYYNDYNAYFPEKSQYILALAESINTFAQDEEGNDRILCDGIGMQGYIGGYGTQEGCLEEEHLDWIRDAITGYADAGLKVQITEMAVRNFEKDQADAHAEYYAKLFGVFKDLYDEEAGNPLNCVAIWALTDYPNAPKGNYVYNLNSPYGGLVDEFYNKKDAFFRVEEELSR